VYEGEIEYPITLKHQIQDMLEDVDDWECENEVCTIIFEEKLIVNAFTTDNEDQDTAVIIITSEFFFDIRNLTYFPETNLWKILTTSRDGVFFM